MATIIDLNTLREFTGNTPDFQDDADKLIIDRKTIDEWEAFKRRVPQKYWKRDRNAIIEMEQAEKDAIDVAFLAGLKKQRISEFAVGISDYINAKYTPSHKETISYLMDAAFRQGRTNQFNYFDQVGRWAIQCLTYYYTQEAKVQAARSVDEVMAVPFDFTDLDRADPGVKIRVGLVIPD